MKTPDDLNRLLDDVLAPDAADEFRAAALQSALTALRRRKRRQALTRRLALVALPLALAAGLMIAHQQKPSKQPEEKPVAAVTPPINTVPGTEIRLISDEELFALFPGRPMALIGPKGAQQLVFLDEPLDADGMAH